MLIRRLPHHIAALVLLSGSASAGEYAVLLNGFRIHADRHERTGSQIRLFNSGGFTEVAAAEISCFEQEEYAAPAAPAPAAKAAAAPVAPVTAPPQAIWEAAAKKHGIPAALVKSVIAAESGFKANAVSPKGAIGLMQLMPSTAKSLGANPHVPAENVDAGTQYLRELLARYEDRDDQVVRAVAAYNAGPGAVDRYHGLPPYRETRDYVRRVLRNYESLSR